MAVGSDGGTSGAVDGNALLGEIAPVLSPHLQRRLELVSLDKNQSLLLAGDEVRHVYFPTSGLVSVATLTSDGQAVDLATIAREGLVGVSVILAKSAAPHNAIVRIQGQALRVGSGELCLELRSNERLRGILLEYANRLSIEVSQAVACQCFHAALSRLARWLVVASERTRSEMLEVTQDSLSQILGLARPVVTKAAIELQDAGAVRCRHGRITVLNRSMLERSACECLAASRSISV